MPNTLCCIIKKHTTVDSDCAEKHVQDAIKKKAYYLQNKKSSPINVDIAKLFSSSVRALFPGSENIMVMLV